MSNEELTALIQAGDQDRLMELWGQTRSLVLKVAHRWAAYRSGGVELEDLEQAGFIALMRAVASFDRTVGTSFASWFYKFILSEFTAATGRGSEKKAGEPLNFAVSLDAPVSVKGSQPLLLEEAIPDERAQADFEKAERREDLRRLRALLMEAVEALPPLQCAAVMARYWGGERVGWYQQNLQHALRNLRRQECSQRLREFL